MRTPRPIFAVLLVACGGAQPVVEDPTPVAVPATESTETPESFEDAPSIATPEQVATLYFNGLVARDPDQVRDVVAFPHLWDDGCRQFATMPELDAAIRQLPDLSEISLVSVSPLPDEFLQRMTERARCDRPESDPADVARAEQAAAMSPVWMLVIIRGPDGDENEMVIRVSNVDGRWLASGFKD